MIGDILRRIGYYCRSRSPNSKDFQRRRLADSDSSLQRMNHHPQSGRPPFHSARRPPFLSSGKSGFGIEKSVTR